MSIFNRNKRDQFLLDEANKILQTDEKILNTGTVFQGPPVLPPLRFFYALVTNKRFILIESGMGPSGMKLNNQGVISFDFSELRDVKAGGFLNIRKLVLYKNDGTTIPLKYNTLVRQISGHKAFCKEVPLRLAKLIQLE